MLAHLVDKLAKTQDGDGTLLDQSLVLYGSNMGNSNQHVHYDVPHVLVGGLNGKLKGGRHLAYPTKTVPTGNLLLSVLDKFDIHQDSIGDSTGRLEDSVNARRPRSHEEHDCHETRDALALVAVVRCFAIVVALRGCAGALRARAMSRTRPCAATRRPCAR